MNLHRLEQKDKKRGGCMDFKIDERVTRKSYDHDLLFRIVEITDDIAILQGEHVRLMADANVADLSRVDERDLKKRTKKVKQREEQSYQLFRQDYRLLRRKLDYEEDTNKIEELTSFQVPIQVLHLDGDPHYLKKCLDLYKRLGIDAEGIDLREKDMPEKIESYIEKYRPSCLVITGHDAYSEKKGNKYDLRAYRHSRYFAETVRKARNIEPSLDQLVIFAGACQSHFESLIRSGANFASSPSRINIHALDPVYIVAKIAYTSFMDKVNIHDVIRNTLTGAKGMGGIETRGLQRTGMPYVDNDADEKR